jgi:3-oxoadipate enol-lactonase
VSADRPDPAELDRAAPDRPDPEDLAHPEHLADLVEGHPNPPIILVPGIDGTALLFYRQQPLLARSFDVVAFPLPDDPDLTMGDLVADLHRLITEVSDQGAILLGESFGGALSLSTAMAHPDEVRGLVIVNSFPWLARRLQIAVAPTAMRLIPWGAMPLVRAFTESRLHSRHTLPDDLAEFHERAKAIGRKGYIRRLEIIRHYDIRHRLHMLVPPVLYLAGDQDRLLPSDYWARYMASRTPRADLTILEGYGHVCLINHDLDLHDHVAPWWAAVSAADSSPGPGG